MVVAVNFATFCCLPRTRRVRVAKYTMQQHAPEFEWGARFASESPA